MKTKSIISIETALLLSVFSFQLSAFSQGSLTPPGAPAPTMKTLDQVEPRTIVNAVNTPGDSLDSFVISQSGSYYLATNLVGVSGKSGIEIAANNVTLDLNGFSLQGVSLANAGIYLPNACTNITVRNGTISGWGEGAYAASPSAANLVFERLNVSANLDGIWDEGSGVVRDCNIENNFDYYGDGIIVSSGTVSACDVLNSYGGGIYLNSGTVSGCDVANNGDGGIYVGSGTVSGCTAQDNTYGGILAYSATVSGCTVQNNSGPGIYLDTGGAVSGCCVSSNTASGILVAGNGIKVIGNTCNGNNTSHSGSDGGIFIAGNNNRVEDNHVTASGNTGIAVASIPAGYTNNVIIKNSVWGDAANNYSTPSGNDLGPVGTAATATSPWANISH